MTGNPAISRSILLITGVFMILPLLLSTAVLAQEQEPDSLLIVRGEGYIEKMNEHVGLKLSLDNGFETFRVDTETNDFLITPNITTVALFGIQYRFVRFSVGWAPEFIPGNGDREEKGTTESFSFGIAVFVRNWIQELDYSRVTGFYLENSEDYIPWEPGDPYIQFPDLHYTGFSGSTSYQVNPRLSIKSLTIQTERQLRSAGSFVAGLNYRYYIVDDRSVPSSGGATQKSQNLEWNIAPGYYYTFVAREKFYAALGLAPGLGMIHTKLTTRLPSGDAYSYQNNLVFRWEGRAGLGYNGRIFFGGLYASLSGMQYRQENTTAVNTDTRAFFQVFAGFRIKLPEKVNGFFDKITF